MIGLVLAIPLGWLARRYRGLPRRDHRPGLLYTIPSLALFILMPSIIGTKILDPINVVVAMTIYTVALLVRMVADGARLGARPTSRRPRGDGLRRLAPVLQRRAAARGAGHRSPGCGWPRSAT